MTRAVTVVIPSLGDLELLERALPPLLEEAETRALGDEVVVVDDTGEAVLEGPLQEAFPTVRVLSQTRNTGFAEALLAGVDAASHALVFSMNPDVVVRAGFLDPLVACLEDEDVRAVVPRVLLDGDPDRVESLTRLRPVHGSLVVDQPALASKAVRVEGGPVAFAVGGACLFRRTEFLERHGFDPLFEPFYWEDVDLGFSMWREGRQVLLQPASVVEHRHRGTIGKVVPPELVRAAQEKNRLLFHWKHLEGDEAWREHLMDLYRTAVDAWLEDRREPLVWLGMALEQLEEALAARREWAVAYGEALRLVGGETAGESRGE